MGYGCKRSFTPETDASCTASPKHEILDEREKKPCGNPSSCTGFKKRRITKSENLTLGSPCSSLECAPNGTVAEYILESGKPLSLPLRLAWCRETAEAVGWIHAHRALHCNIQSTNLLLDKDLHVKLSDLQDKLLAEDTQCHLP
ncbi:63e5e583-75b2-434a-b246-e5597a9f41a7 [Thermothielavioides terrestris]|uniref:63e5e583-75b2-434a-b246-e5597a9f41a7 n=1 Tax=Thermothielavioides terrestris TaxID=2587410 RepID=A0A3S4AQH4_9PEZI|nr:63e5e583-75b2-434a-b246-e5597a9f41a7 [Thermothielavioides terrestris]